MANNNHDDLTPIQRAFLGNLGGLIGKKLEPPAPDMPKHKGRPHISWTPHSSFQRDRNKHELVKGALIALAVVGSMFTLHGLHLGSISEDVRQGSASALANNSGVLQHRLARCAISENHLLRRPLSESVGKAFKLSCKSDGLVEIAMPTRVSVTKPLYLNSGTIQVQFSGSGGSYRSSGKIYIVPNSFQMLSGQTNSNSTPQSSH